VAVGARPCWRRSLSFFVKLTDAMASRPVAADSPDSIPNPEMLRTWSRTTPAMAPFWPRPAWIKTVDRATVGKCLRL